ncbi:unnamed protein product [Urochloa humidicola]
MRKQNKRELSRASLRSDEDLLQAQQHQTAAAAQPAKSPAAVAADGDHRRPLHVGVAGDRANLSRVNME